MHISFCFLYKFLLFLIDPHTVIPLIISKLLGIRSALPVRCDIERREQTPLFILLKLLTAFWGAVFVVFAHSKCIFNYRFLYLLCVKAVHCILYRLNSVEQAAVSLCAVFCNYSCRLSFNQSFFFKSSNIFSYSIRTDVQSLADSFVARIALICFSVFTFEQVGVQAYFSCSQTY